MPPETTPDATGETPAAPDAQSPASAPTGPAGPAGTSGTPTASPAATSQTDGSQAEPFDPERAMRTIAQLREIERKAKADARELATLKAAQQAREDADLSEKDRATKRTAELEAQLKDTTTTYRTKLLRLTAEGVARDLRFRDPKLAVRLLDLDAVELDDDGEPTNLPALLKAELKANPYLAEAEPVDPGPAPIGATPRPANGQALSATQRQQLEQEMQTRVRRAWG
jgi:hypothetical protein